MENLQTCQIAALNKEHHFCAVLKFNIPKYDVEQKSDNIEKLPPELLNFEVVTRCAPVSRVKSDLQGRTLTICLPDDRSQISVKLWESDRLVYILMPSKKFPPPDVNLGNICATPLYACSELEKSIAKMLPRKTHPLQFNLT
ncbi:hypothetical protein [Edaphobacter modestus]|uniref:Uncharacterized protein n=1 Tax=Edaphobacter modestus TaxID=388466 RepID=A0A4Q7YFY8_9BACT|nr:hypothetical protein [Edaphobacter modestus]RZU35199.1 hypothetical protein BDD14_5959 [Edaphobacter modestus]